jgi:hypothetical protein
MPLTARPLLLATLALALAGCAPKVRIASVPTAPARAGYLAKSTGKVAFLDLRDDRPVALLSFGHEGTLAQSGEGTLGDRLFREGEHGFAEACRWVAKGRICQLVPLPGGGWLGGAHWIVPVGAAATPKASGWVAQGVFFNPSSGLDRDAMAVNSLAPVLLGRAFHCRFPNEGPVCIEVPATAKTIGYTILGTFSLADGGVRREVIWLGSFGDVQQPGVDRALGIRQIQRCETTEDSPTIDCKPVTLKDP